MLTRLTPLAAAFVAISIAVPSMAQDIIRVGPQSLLGVAIGTDADIAASKLQTILGSGGDSGWIDGCELNGAQERCLTWGGLTAAFQTTQYTGDVFVSWSYYIDGETGAALPMGIHVGDSFSDAADVYGFEPIVDDVFGIGHYSSRYFEIMTSSDDLDGPITEVGVPHFFYCD